MGNKNNDIVVTNQIHEDKGVFTLLVEEEKAGETLYKVYGDERIDIKHTEVDPKYRGKGLGSHLVEAAVVLARKSEMKLSSSCPYASALLKRTEAYSDVYVN